MMFSLVHWLFTARTILLDAGFLTYCVRDQLDRVTPRWVRHRG